MSRPGSVCLCLRERSAALMRTGARDLCHPGVDVPALPRPRLQPQVPCRQPGRLTDIEGLPAAEVVKGQHGSSAQGCGTERDPVSEAVTLLRKLSIRQQAVF